jgi:hypothetical protein
VPHVDDNTENLVYVGGKVGADKKASYLNNLHGNGNIA